MKTSSSRPLGWLLWLALGGLVALVLVMASVPPVSRDALTHHLAVPKLWLQHGVLHEFSDIEFSYYPQLLDLLYLGPLAAGHDIWAKYLHFAFGLATALILFLYVRRRLGGLWGGLAALMFLTLPLILKLSVTVYVDLGLAFFSTAALLSGLMWLERPERWRWLVLAGLCSGLALSTKYNAMVSFVVLALLLPLAAARRQRGRPGVAPRVLGGGLVLVLLALLVFSPWMVRNFKLTGNPIYPLHQSWFQHKGDESGASAARSSAALGPLAMRKLVYDESLPYTLMIPLRIFFEGRDDDPRTFDGVLNPLLLGLPLLLWLLLRRSQAPPEEAALLGGYATLILLYTFFTTDMRVRYVIAAVPALVLLSVYGLQALQAELAARGVGRPARAAVLGLLLAGWFVPNLIYARTLYARIDPMPYLEGRVSRDQYIAAHLGEYPLVQKINRMVGPHQRLLALYLGHRRYYFDVPVSLDRDRFWHLAESAPDGRVLLEQLRAAGFSHLLVRFDLFNRVLQHKSPAVQRRVLQLFDLLQPVDQARGYGLFVLPGTPEKA